VPLSLLCCHGYVDLELGTVVLLLFQDRGVVPLMDMGTLGVMNCSGLMETRRYTSEVDEVPVPLLAEQNGKLKW